MKSSSQGGNAVEGSALAQELRRQIVECGLHGDARCNVTSDGRITDCHCNRNSRLNFATRAIDAALEQARREERERVKAVVQWFVDMPGAFDDDGILTDIIEAIEDPTIKFEPWSKES